MTALSTTARTPLTRSRIAQAALDVLDRDGLDALSMRRLGAELGVEGMAIYRHFPNKAAVLAGVVEVLLAELEIPAPSPDVAWQLVLKDVSRAYRALLLGHPNAIPLLATLPLTDPAAARAAGAVMALVRAAGFDAQTALKTLATITSYVVGVAQWEVGTAPYRAEGRDVTLPADADPYLVELLPQLAEDDCDETFEFGLDVIVRGLESRS
jgi:AcrR family transcriptional regulator